MASLATETSSTNLGARRNKTAKPIPRLPPGAFSPPNTGTGERFPLPPSPATVHPQALIDASAAISSIDDLKSYSSALGASVSGRLSGVVASVPESAVASISQITGSGQVPVLAISIPLSESTVAAAPEGVKVAYNIEFVQSSPSESQRVKNALSKGVVEVSVVNDLSSDAGWEALEEFLSAALAGFDLDSTKPAIVLANILPPPKSLNINTVSLLSHPSYLAYQAHIATLSFYTPVYVRLSPPDWAPSSDPTEWSNRLKMYLGPVIEAFGFSRILFATSGVSSSATPANWYEMAREAIAELGIDQDGVDAIFGGNARAVYGAA